MGTRPKKPLYRDAIRDALADAMDRDRGVFLTGECVEGLSTWGPSAGLDERFPDRVRDTPISEAAMIGHAIGAAMVGLKPVVEIMIGDFLTCAMDEIVNQAAKVRLMSGGQLTAPIVVRAATGTGKSSAGQHSQSFESWFTHVPGLIVAVPTTAQDAYDILTNAIEGEDPTLIFEYKRLYPMPGEWERRPALGAADIGKAAVRIEGNDCTVIATGTILLEVLEIVRGLGDQASIEVIDPRYLWPLDIEAIEASVAKTKKVLIVEETPHVGSFGAWLEAEVARRCFHALEEPVARLSGAHVPRAFAPQLEAAARPGPELIKQTLLQMARGGVHASR
jgi:pyruvate dehydrogenase E1 component beta subunit